MLGGTIPTLFLMNFVRVKVDVGTMIFVLTNKQNEPYSVRGFVTASTTENLFRNEIFYFPRGYSNATILSEEDLKECLKDKNYIKYNQWRFNLIREKDQL